MTAPFMASLYVGDLKGDVSEPDLYTHFSRIGSVAGVRVCRDSLTQRSLGYAYVNFHNPEDAEHALNDLNYTPIKGQACRIMWAQKDPSHRRSGVGNLFVSNLAKTVDSKLLHETFSTYGDIASCKVMTDPKTNESRGFGFVQFEKQEQADRAIADVTGKVLHDLPISVVPARPKAQTRPTKQTNVYVKDFDPNMTDEKLRELFAPYGEISNCVVQRNADGTGRGFGFCNFKETESGQRAIEALNGTMQGGKGPMFVGWWQSRRERMLLLKQQYQQYTQCNLYVKHLDDSFDETKLRSTFEPYGRILSCKLVRDENGASRGFGYVCFSLPEEAGKAIQSLQHQVVGQKKLYVNYHQRKEERRQFMESGGYRYPNMRQYPGAQWMPGYPGFYPYPYPMSQQQQQQQAAGYARMPYPPQAGRGYAQGARQQFPFPRQRRDMQQQHMGYNVMPSGSNYPPSTFVQGATPGRRPQHQQPSKPMDQKPETPAVVPPVTPAQPQSQPAVNEAEIRRLYELSPESQKDAIGELLYPIIEGRFGDLAGKITGMLLEMEPSELIGLLDTREELDSRIQEAYEVLQQAQMQPEGTAKPEA